MASLIEPDDSVQISEFLKRVQELGVQRDQEDEERNRKLEEEILQGRKERQARRAERARSISPTKDSPLITPRSQTPNNHDSPRTPPRYSLSPTKDLFSSIQDRDSAVKDTMSRLTSGRSPDENLPVQVGGSRDIAETSPIKVAVAGQAPSDAITLSRTSTLSWQRRPASQASDRPRSRPLSMIAAENAARSPRASPEPFSTSEERAPTPREQIANSLASKDPAWFRQNPDRAGIAAAYRKNQVEDSDIFQVPAGASRMQLPGMGLGQSKESESKSNSSTPGHRPPSRNQSSIPSTSSNPSADNTSKHQSIGSPIPILAAQMFPPPESDMGTGFGMDLSDAGRLPAMSPAQGRISPARLDRPTSPTKGLGGFVQSAMMKRSDSVNKRWSVQPPSGLSRGDSLASSRSSIGDGMGPSRSGSVESSIQKTQMSNSSRESTPTSSRPASRHNHISAVGNGSSQLQGSLKLSDQHDAGENKGNPASLAAETPPPSSPTRLGDSRRWSPTKSSWLESALNKPEAAKPKIVPQTQQPAWMKEMKEAKQKGSVDIAPNQPSRHKHEVSIGGLLRSPPMGGLAKPLSVGGLPAGFASGNMKSALAQGGGSRDPILSPAKGSLENLEKDSKTLALRDTETSRSEMSASTQFTSRKTPVPSPSSDKVKPATPPKKDFHSQINSRPTLAEHEGKTEPEFRNIFGQLRRTKTQNYVAPDELKDNILRGKAGLTQTGGPQKTERKDEFKEAILKKKEDFKKAQLEGVGVIRPSRTTAAANNEVPEALSKRAAIKQLSNTGEKPAIIKPNTAGSPGIASSSRRVSRDSVSLALHHETSAPGRLQSKDEGGSGRLADKFHPGLAGILARGPPSGSQKPLNPTLSNNRAPEGLDGSVNQNGRPQLTHMTKARARGPRRRAPASKLANAQDQRTVSTPDATPTAAEAIKAESVPKGVGPKASPKPDAFRIQNTAENEPENLDAEPVSPRKLDLKRRSKFLEEVSNKNEKTPQQTEKPKAFSSLKSTAIISKDKSASLPFTKQETSTRTAKETTSTPAPSVKVKPSPMPKSPTLLQKENPKISPPRSVANTEPASPQRNEATKLFTGFFGNTDGMRAAPLDTAAILSGRPDSAAKIKSHNSQLFQLLQDGKKQAISAHQERILFEAHTYLCVHEFTTPSGERVTEVYLWVGDGVTESAAEEAAYFARNTQRQEKNATLVTIRQGKETPEFIEALGGIIVIRRGSSNKFDSLAPHILCGRQHVGQIVFDEVEFSPLSLCSGFPYLVVSPTGKLYLWKGKGSGIEELSCARLIGMDFGVTGEIDEVDEGKEPADFLSLFGASAKILKSADHWRMKPSFAKYGCRLFRSDPDSASKVVEIHPFSQADLSPSDIYIVDAFFEIYVIVGARSQAQYQAFCTALVFAQEYGILAAGMEDRPHVPFSTVVVEGVPRDLKFVFRKWQDSLAPTIVQQPAGGLARGRSLRVVPLTAALDATRC